MNMLTLQDRMNRIVNPDWINAGYPFLRAIVVEVGEALDHYGWKWWKKQCPNIEQVQIELIDILHFMLSHILISTNGNTETAALLIAAESQAGTTEIEFDSKQYLLLQMDTRQMLELLAGLAASRRISFAVFEAIFVSCGMTWESVVLQYVSKNVLNIFRQTNGYKEGNYFKEWGGMEDNVFLVEISKSLDVSGATFITDLYSALERQYAIELAKK